MFHTNKYFNLTTFDALMVKKLDHDVHEIK